MPTKLVEATIKIKPGRDRDLKVKGILGVLEASFYRKPSNALKAKEFLEYVANRQRESRPMHIKEWREYCESHDLTQTSFYNIVHKLRGAGVLRKERDEYVTSRDFSRFLKVLADIWDAWKDLVPEELETESK